MLMANTKMWIIKNNGNHITNYIHFLLPDGLSNHLHNIDMRTEKIEFMRYYFDNKHKKKKCSRCCVIEDKAAAVTLYNKMYIINVVKVHLLFCNVTSSIITTQQIIIIALFHTNHNIITHPWKDSILLFATCPIRLTKMKAHRKIYTTLMTFHL